MAASLRLAGAAHPAAAQRAVARAVDAVVVHEPGGLHEGVADGGAHEAEAALLEVAAHGVRLRGARRDLLEAPARVLERGAAHELPDVAVEAAELLLHREEGPRVRDRGLDLEPVAHDPRIG